MKISITYKDGAKDKVDVVVHNRDLWSADVTLARVIYPVLKKYRKLHDAQDGLIGYPSDFAPDPLKPEGPDNPDRFDEWLKCLDKMIYSFELIAKKNDWDGPAKKEYHQECDKLLKPYKNELKKLAKEDDKRFAAITDEMALPSLEWNRRAEITHPLWDIYYPKFKEHEKKVQEGIDLFAKYFGDLWT